MGKHVDIKRWIAFYTKPRCEKKINDVLIEREIESFLPIHKYWSKWSDRKKLIEEPLFKSYIFAKINEADRLKIITMKEIIKTVHFNHKISVIPEYQIQNLKIALEKRNEEISFGNKIPKGNLVKIVRGPLEGLIGKVMHDSDGDYIYLEVKGVGKNLRVKLFFGDIIQLVKESQ